MRIPKLIDPSVNAVNLKSVPESASLSPRQAAVALDKFLSCGGITTILSGAGISVDSNIPDYRGIWN